MDGATALMVLSAFLGGLIRGFSGFGGPMIMIPVLNLFYPPSLTIWMMAMIDLPSNVYLIPSARKHANARIWVPLSLGTFATMSLGVYLLVVVDETVMRSVICVGIILACCVLLSGWLYRGQMGKRSWAMVGAASGLVLGATYIAVVTTVFVNAASRDAQGNRANIIFWAFATSIVMIVLLSYGGIADSRHFPMITMLAAIYFFSCIAGTLAQQRFGNSYARTATLLLIILIAIGGLASTHNLSR
ncbi:MAG: sulfite exporter TauE/SafE family protein [Hyphomicrobiaceae bacterium]